MPGIQRYSIDRLFYKLEEVEELKIPLIAIFPCLEDHLKTNNGEEALNEEGLICSTIREIKSGFLALELWQMSLLTLTLIMDRMV